MGVVALNRQNGFNFAAIVKYHARFIAGKINSAAHRTSGQKYMENFFKVLQLRNNGASCRIRPLWGFQNSRHFCVG